MSELVEYIECSEDIPIKHKLQISRCENGDFYLSILPEKHVIGPTIRIETSGGAITENCRMVKAINLLYLALSKDFETFDEIIRIKNDT